MTSGGLTMEEAMALQTFHPERLEALRALTPADRVHLHHAWAQAEDGDGINRPHIDACVRLGFMEKAGQRRWIFTPDGEDAADALYVMWQCDLFDPITGDFAAPKQER